MTPAPRGATNALSRSCWGYAALTVSPTLSATWRRASRSSWSRAPVPRRHRQRSRGRRPRGPRRRARQHLNGAHNLATAELAAPFGCDGVFVRANEPLLHMAHHLGHAATEIDGAGALNDADQLRAVHARLGPLPTAAQAA